MTEDLLEDNVISNPTDNRKFNDIVQSRISRRDVLKGSLGGAVLSFFSTSTLATTINRTLHGISAEIDFTPVPLADGNSAVPVISEDYQYEVLIPWGEPLEPGGPEYHWPPTAEDQAKQIGTGHDGMTYFPMNKEMCGNYSDGLNKHYTDVGNSHGILAINHEFGRNTHVLGKEAPESLSDVRTSQHAHGVSIVEIKKTEEKWQTVKSVHARRIHVNTPVSFSGPAAGHALLQTLAGNIPLGTVNNCASGPTPWGTYLTCEENFNGYFGATNKEQTWMPTESQERYGFSDTGFGYNWHEYDARFDLSNPDYVNEENRFGWVVEIDPYDGTQTPVKRTALGRFKHEGATTVIGENNRAVVYMGDDQRFDYIYKFVSSYDYQYMMDAGKSPLDEGVLYVAKFNDDGTGVWLPLTLDHSALASRFADMGELLVNTRLAADILGATPMDRPEWISVGPNGDTYCTLTNNSRREVADAANPMAPNADGHIIRWHDSGHHTGRTFVWDIFLIAEETHGTEESFSDPDGIWVDPDGRLFIETDGGQADGLNNQLLVADTKTGKIKRLLTGVPNDEITGLTVTPDRRTMFVNTQHPGNGDPSLTNFPAPTDGVTIPRDCTIVITKKDGGIIGS